MPGTPKSLNAYLAERLRQLRLQKRWSQDDLGRQAREKGLPWNRGVVLAIEQGRRQVSVAELLMLTLVFTMDLAAFFEGGEPVALTPQVTTRPCDICDYIAKKLPLRLSSSGSGKTRDLAHVARWFHPTAEIAESEVVIRKLWAAASRLDLQRAVDAALGTAEEKAASKLGYSAVEVSLAAHRLWGKSLTLERDARVAATPPRGKPTPRTMQARKGHVSRQLLDDLRPVLENYRPSRRRR